MCRPSVGHKPIIVIYIWVSLSEPHIVYQNCPHTGKCVWVCTYCWPMFVALLLLEIHIYTQCNHIHLMWFMFYYIQPSLRLVKWLNGILGGRKMSNEPTVQCTQEFLAVCCTLLYQNFHILCSSTFVCEYLSSMYTCNARWLLEQSIPIYMLRTDIRLGPF